MKDNPLSKYPKPPFQEQTQAWPGLAGKMHPKPDQGEASDKGSGRLIGRKALITGGDSGTGRAAAIAYAREGANVAINYLPAEESDAKEVIQFIKDVGRQQAKPSMLDISDEDFDATMRINIYAPLHLIKATLTHLSEGSCIIGTTSEQAYDPAADL